MRKRSKMSAVSAMAMACVQIAGGTEPLDREWSWDPPLAGGSLGDELKAFQQAYLRSFGQALPIFVGAGVASKPVGKRAIDHLADPSAGGGRTAHSVRADLNALIAAAGADYKQGREGILVLDEALPGRARREIFGGARAETVLQAEKVEIALLRADSSRDLNYLVKETTSRQTVSAQAGHEVAETLLSDTNYAWDVSIGGYPRFLARLVFKAGKNSVIVDLTESSSYLVVRSAHDGERAHLVSVALLDGPNAALASLLGSSFADEKKVQAVLAQWRSSKSTR